MKKTKEEKETEKKRLTLKRILKQKLKNRQIVKSQRATVDVSSPDVQDITDDRSRFFKEQWKEDRRSLFFK